jgi:hypothetical protein
MSIRKHKTETLTKAAMHYFVKKNYGVSIEIAVKEWGKLRADIVALNKKAEIVIVEVKSCKEDYIADCKMHHYLPYCNRQYLLVYYKDSWISDYYAVLKELGIGIMLLEEDGYVKVLKNAKYRPMKGTVKKDIIVRMAWRGAQYSKRNTKRRLRCYL